jgi:isoleucyl-tRNA synthetase
MFKPLKPGINFPKLEQEILDYWHVRDIVDKYLNKNRLSTQRFSFLDGPITANNPMGVHHGWGRTYKDLWQRFFNMRGYRQRFQNGFDCQGLWVEVEVERELGIKTKKDIENIVVGDKKASIAKFVDLCKSRVQKFANIQTEQSKRLGYFMDWENSYYTMSDENNYMIWFFIKTCHENGWIYKGTDVVPWCPRCETAISQHEILTEDYKEVTHTSIYLKLPIKDRKNEYLLIWTTTPWTIPANTAVAVDPDLEYSLVASDGEKYWVARKLADRIFGKGFKPLETVKGSELVDLRYRGPYDHLPYVSKIAPFDMKLFHTVVATDPLIMPISVEEGTGLVHTSTSTGEEDHRLGKKIGLPVIPAIDDRANYLEGFGELTGKNAKKNPDLILTYLENKKWIFKTEKYTHRYPVCWRCKEELVWRVTDEWYIAMDKKPLRTQNSELRTQNLTLRQRMIEVAKKIRWIPEFGLERELDWLNNMHDWLISKKNRYWGLALPIWGCKKCGYFEVIGSKEELKEKAVEGWKEFEGKSPHKPQIDEVKIKCSKCNTIISRIEPVGNPWLDAG